LAIPFRSRAATNAVGSFAIRKKRVSRLSCIEAFQCGPNRTSTRAEQRVAPLIIGAVHSPQTIRAIESKRYAATHLNAERQRPCSMSRHVNTFAARERMSSLSSRKPPALDFRKGLELRARNVGVSLACNCACGSKSRGSRDLEAFERGHFETLVVSRWVIVGSVLHAFRGSHRTRSKVFSYARAEREPELYFPYRVGIHACKTGIVYVRCCAQLNRRWHKTLRRKLIELSKNGSTGSPQAVRPLDKLTGACSLSSCTVAQSTIAHFRWEWCDDFRPPRCSGNH